MKLIKLEKPYMRSEQIRQLQRDLDKLGFNPEGVDGVYGKNSYKAVRAFQKFAKIEIDGVVGEQTLKAINNYLGLLETPTFPEVPMTPIGEFLKWICEQIGCLYVWGAQGQKMTVELIERREQNAKNRRRALDMYNQHLRHGLPIIGYDCSGLIVRYLLKKGFIKYDMTANGLKTAQCFNLDKDELQAGDLVFKYSYKSKRCYHVGVYMGDGTVVHAKGRSYGVVREEISKAGWNRFGRLKVFASEEPKQTPKLTRLLKYQKPYMRGDDVRELQRALTNNGFDTDGVDGVFGKNTRKAVEAYQEAKDLKVDGLVGKMTWGKLF